jgi:hypothetical protein
VDDELAQRSRIRDTLVRYTLAFRRKDVELLDGVFARDAIIDYRASGGPHGDWATARAWIASVLSGCHRFLLYVGDSTYAFSADGRSADVETSWQGVFVQHSDGPSLQVYGTYDDRFVRVGDRWWIQERADHPLWQVASPAPLAVEGG